MKLWDTKQSKKSSIAFENAVRHANRGCLSGLPPAAKGRESANELYHKHVKGVIKTFAGINLQINALRRFQIDYNLKAQPREIITCNREFEVKLARGEVADSLLIFPPMVPESLRENVSEIEPPSNTSSAAAEKLFRRARAIYF